MKISLLIDSLGAGGAQRQIVGLACLLKEAEYDVEIVTYHYMDFYDSILKEVGVPHVFVPGSQNKYRRIITIGKYILKSKPDVVIAYQSMPSLIASIVRLFNHSFQLIVSERNTTQRYTYMEMIRFNLYRVAKYVVPNSYTQGQFIEKHAPFLQKKTKVITNFVDIDRFHPLVMYSGRVGQKPIHLLTYGRITPQKNILNYIKAIKKVKDAGYCIKADWFGSKEGNVVYAKQCDELLSELDMNNIFFFHDPIKDVNLGYNRCSVFVLPSVFEGTPNVVCEAMSCGLPILCSNVCDNPRLVSSENGILFNPNDVEDIANSIIYFCDLKDELKISMAMSSRILAETKYGSDNFLKQYIALFN